MIEKNDHVEIFDNSIFECMGHKVVSGTVIHVRANGEGFSFKCLQTGSVETCDLDDGKIIINGGSK